MSEHLIAALAPITSRVRTDVTAIKTAQGGSVWAKGEALTKPRLLAHLNGGTPRGCCPIKAGESTTRLGLFDLDSHQGQSTWAQMVAATEALIDELEKRGCYPVAFRSTGGRGVHVFVVWDEPQDAYSVRVFLREVLAATGFKDGTKGVASGEVEVFPKQNSVAANGYGNQFILPLAGKSEPLEPLLGYEPAGRDHALSLVWRGSAPVPVEDRPVHEPREAAEFTDARLKELQAALVFLGNDDDYDTWRDTVLGIHADTDGSDEGYALALEYSSWNARFEEERLREKVWDWATNNPTDGPRVTGASILARARNAGWNDVSADDFEIIEPPAEEEETGPATRVLDPKDTMLLARSLLRGVWTPKGRASLLRSSGLWYGHAGPCWQEVPDDEVRQSGWVFLDKAKKEVTVKKEDADGKKKNVTSIVPFCPTMAQVTSTVDALKAVAGVKGLAPPCWLPGYEGPDPRELVSVADGLLHIPTRSLSPHTPGFFALNTLPYGWGEDGQPTAWLRFLDEVWGDDQEAQDALQEMFGYLLTADTSQQKMFLIRGPKRSGKGTIARVLGALVGRENMVSPTLTSLTSNFGLQPLIGKLVAMIPDARIGAQTNTQAVVEKLLMLSGEDSITVDRKNKDAWTGQLSARVVVMSNEVPQLGDASGALAGRFVTISMTKSFFGREDLGLTDRLLKELPAIFRWALDGRDRLDRRGYFVQPESAAEDAAEMYESSSPIGVFIDEVMEKGAAFTVPVKDAYDAWVSWCGENGRSHPGTVQTFSKSLRASEPDVTIWRPRDEEERRREFTLIRIKPHVRQRLGLFE